MDIQYAIFEGDTITNITDIDEEIAPWIIPVLVGYFPTWVFVRYDTLTKRDDGNPNIIWISWVKDSLGEMYAPNWIPPE